MLCNQISFDFQWTPGLVKVRETCIALWWVYTIALVMCKIFFFMLLLCDVLHSKGMGILLIYTIDFFPEKLNVNEFLKVLYS